jgi:cytochrome c oxidase subunit 2
MSSEPTIQLPRQLSTIAPEVDRMYYAIFWGSVAFFTIITVLTVYWAWKYRAQPGRRAARTGHSTLLEVIWVVSPFLVLVPLFHYGFKTYMHGMVAPKEAIEIRVRGKQWVWEFEYPNGMREAGVLRVPVHKPVELVMSFDDVIHSLFVPEFRVKCDVIPGMYTSLWFEATETAELDIYCTEYCGTSHSGMLAKLHVVTEEEYDKFLEEGAGPPDGVTPVEWGEQLFVQNACATCHSRDGSTLPGPTFKGLYGRDEVMEDGTELTVDENYLRESILRPQAQIVKGYSNVVMPTFFL